MGAKQPTPQEQMRATKRQIGRAIRELDRERMKLQAQEKKLIQDIKKTAKLGQNASVKAMAKDLVRIRRHVTKFYEMRSQLQSVELTLQTVKSTHSMSEALKSVNKSMKAFNKQMNLPELNRIMREFMQENERMGMTEEFMADAVDMAMADEGEEEETDKVVNEVLAEIGIDLNEQLEAGHMRAVGREEQKDNMTDLEERFKNLR
mmetsp:Transcript_6488/g.11346  ORF Transcript_6488/g.11346 Transcript_6488/m.11346 type:complete len:205 (-) Transcript_6488:51-665(-)